MSDLPAPTARRLRRPGWRDTRLVVGVLLVLASVTIGSYVVAHADDRVPVYAAAHPLVPGQRLSDDDLVRVDVQLGAQDARYLAARTGLPSDRFVLREVPAGELVPVSAVGTGDQVRTQPLTLTVDAGSAAVLHVGDRVDVYVNPVLDNGTEGGKDFKGPELRLQSVSVAGLPKTSTGLGGGGSDRSIQVMAPTDQVKGVIGDVDRGARVTVVPVVAGAQEGAR